MQTRLLDKFAYRGKLCRTARHAFLRYERAHVLYIEACCALHYSPLDACIAKSRRNYALQRYEALLCRLACDCGVTSQRAHAAVSDTWPLVGNLLSAGL